MKNIKNGFSIIISLISMTSALPCTEFRLQAKDSSVLIARTMEFGVDMNASLRSSPRNRVFTTKDHTGKTNTSWKGKYGFIFFDAFNIDVAIDGLNERGLSFGALYLPGLTQYQTVPQRNHKSVLPYIYLGDWILSQFSTVEEVKAALKKIYLVQTHIKEFGDTVFPLHASVYDALGNGLVIEYINGQLKLYDNKIGVLTNSPSYDWHLANLNNYIHLNPSNPNPVSLNGVTLTPYGYGFGMLGLPGDTSPASRFVKIATFLRFTTPSENTSSTLNMAAHIMNNVDIPRGLIRASNPIDNSQVFETTQWTAFKDLTHKTFYFKTYDNLQLRSISLNQIDFSENAKRLRMPVASAQVIEDVTSRFLSSLDSEEVPNFLSVKMTAADGQNAKGTLNFTQIGKTLVISGEVFGLTPGAHGFHIHEHATCEDHHMGFKEAGGHFNPSHVVHGTIEHGHAGDLGNIYADKNGRAKVYLQTQKININNDGNEFSILHRTVMIHADQDDLKTDPAGNSGVRILCGVIG